MLLNTIFGTFTLLFAFQALTYGTIIDVNKAQLDKLNATIYVDVDETVDTLNTLIVSVQEAGANSIRDGDRIVRNLVRELELQLDAQLQWYKVLQISDAILESCERDTPIDTDELADRFVNDYQPCIVSILQQFIDRINNVTVDVRPLNAQLGQFANRLYVCYTDQRCLSQLHNDLLSAETVIDDYFSSATGDIKRLVAAHLIELENCEVNAENNFNNLGDQQLRQRLDCLHTRFCVEQQVCLSNRAFLI